MLSNAGVSPRKAMELMRHTDLRLTMKVYTDPRIFDLAGAVERLPASPTTQPKPVTAGATNMSEADVAGRTKSVTTTSTGIGDCSAVIGTVVTPQDEALTLGGDSDWQQYSPSGGDGELVGAVGFEPTKA